MAPANASVLLLPFQETAAAYAEAVKLQPLLAVRVLQRHKLETEIISEAEMMASSADLGWSLHQLLTLVPLTNRELRVKVQAVRIAKLAHTLTVVLERNIEAP